MMLPMEWLFSWGVTSFAVGLLVGIGFAFVGLGDFRLARVTFIVAAADAAGSTIMWGRSTTMPAVGLSVVAFLGIGTIGLASVWSLRYVKLKQDAKNKPSQRSDTSLARPQLEIGLVLGADKGIGIDSIVDCSNPRYTCFSEEELKTARLIFDVGNKGWGRLIFRFKNIGGEKLLHPVTHIESSEPISIESATRPNPARFPRNVLDISDASDIYPFSIADAQAALPVDITVPPSVSRFDLRLNTFSENMQSHKASFHFEVKRTEPVKPEIPASGDKREKPSSPPTAVGSITQGSGSIAQIGGTGNTAIIQANKEWDLTRPQQITLTEAFKESHGRVRISWTDHDLDAIRYAGQLAYAFKDAGWTIQDNVPGYAGSLCFPSAEWDCYGLQIVVRDQAAKESVSNVIAALFALVPQSHIAMSDKNDADLIDIFISKIPR